MSDITARRRAGARALLRRPMMALRVRRARSMLDRVSGRLEMASASLVDMPDRLTLPTGEDTALLSTFGRSGTVGASALDQRLADVRDEPGLDELEADLENIRGAVEELRGLVAPDEWEGP